MVSRAVFVDIIVVVFGRVFDYEGWRSGFLRSAAHDVNGSDRNDGSLVVGENKAGRGTVYIPPFAGKREGWGTRRNVRVRDLATRGPGVSPSHITLHNVRAGLWRRHIDPAVRLQRIMRNELDSNVRCRFG